jgi:RyR domain
LRKVEDFGKAQSPVRPVVIVLGWLAAAGFFGSIALWIWLGVDPAADNHLPGVLSDFGDAHAWWPLLTMCLFAMIALICLFNWPQTTVRKSAIATAVFGVSAAILGVAGYWPCSGAESPGWTPLRQTFDIFGGTMERPFGEVAGCPAELPLVLQAARLLALAAIAIVAGRAIGLLFSSGLHNIRARQARQLVVFSGLSNTTASALRVIRRSLTSQQTFVIFSDGSEVDLHRALARQLRALTVVLNVDDPSAVKRFFSGHAGRALRGIYLMSDDASFNLRAMENILGAVGTQSPKSSTVPGRLVVRIDNPWQAEDWRRREIPAYADWLVDAASTYEIAARHVVAKLRDDHVEELVLSGRSPFELAVLSELSFQFRVAQAVGGFFGDESGIKALIPLPTVVLTGESADEVASHFRVQLRRYGIRETGVKVKIHKGSVERIMEKGTNAALLFTPVGPADALDATFMAAHHPAWMIFSWDESVRGITKTPLIGRLSLVGPTLEPLKGQGIDTWEWFGRIAHQRYLNAWNKGVPIIGDSAKGRWDEDLSSFTRESNIRSFSAVIRKMKESNRKWASLLGEGESNQIRGGLSADELHDLAVAEHKSWVRHHEEYGWKYSRVRDDKRRRHPLMVKWDDLGEPDQKKDAEVVNATLSLLEVLGYNLVRS